MDARYASTQWSLRVYFLAGSPRRLLTRVQSAVRYLQREEEALWMWGSNPVDHALHFRELLDTAGLRLDRRREFPRAAVAVSVQPGDPLRPLQLAELKRKLAQRLEPAPRVARRAVSVRSA